MIEPGMVYWLYIIDENGNHSESIHYNVGVRPTIVRDVSVEVDMPTIRPSGSIIKPEFYVFNDDAPSYGIISLIVDGEIVSKKSQLFGTGQTQVIFNWILPRSDVYVDYDFTGIVTLYDNTISTAPAIVSTHPKTITVSGTDMPSLEIIQRDGQILADPALIYASDNNENLRFSVLDPQGQCIIGKSEQCLVQESTRDNRGGLVSVNYGEQVLRIKYSGADNPLERFSITSIDPITDKWIVTLETKDGMIPEAHASQEPSVKIKFRYHSEIITVKSE